MAFKHIDKEWHDGTNPYGTFYKEMIEVKLQTLIDIQNAKEAFGTLAVLDDVEIQDMPAVLDFAKVVSNYMKMSRLSAKHNL